MSKNKTTQEHYCTQSEVEKEKQYKIAGSSEQNIWEEFNMACTL